MIFYQHVKRALPLLWLHPLGKRGVAGYEVAGFPDFFGAKACFSSVLRLAGCAPYADSQAQGIVQVSWGLSGMAPAVMELGCRGSR